MIEIRWHGRGGQGSFTGAKLLGLAAAVYGGKFAQAFPSFGPERRGAPVLGFNRIDEKKITDRSEPDSCDYLVILDETLWNGNILSGTKQSVKIIINTSSPERYGGIPENRLVSIDATKMALEYFNLPITNTAMLGALVAVSGVVDMDACHKSMENSISPKFLEKNIKIFDKAYEIVRGRNIHE